METTERIVEAYVRYVRGCATIPNIRCPGQGEIDLLAIHPISLDRYHIEVSVSISQGFSKLTAKPYDAEKAKVRLHQAGQRRTLGFFAEKKFGAAGVIERLRDYGFEPGNYAKVVVTWDSTPDAQLAAKAQGIVLWSFQDMIRELADTLRGSRVYFGDDTLRTLNLFIHATDEKPRNNRKDAGKQIGIGQSVARTDGQGSFWVYENWTHEYASLHHAACSFCNDGRGFQGEISGTNGQWLGPFMTLPEAQAAAEKTGRREVRRCGICAPVSDQAGEF